MIIYSLNLALFADNTDNGNGTETYCVRFDYGIFENNIFNRKKNYKPHDLNKSTLGN